MLSHLSSGEWRFAQWQRNTIATDSTLFDTTSQCRQSLSAGGPLIKMSCGPARDLNVGLCPSCLTPVQVVVS
jgi:hypothetical protein